MSVPECGDLLAREVAAFRERYPAASIVVRSGSSREAVAALLGRRVDLVLLPRELESEERSVMVEGGMTLEGYRIARDAICVIVHPGSRVRQIAADDVRRIYTGAVTDWAELGGDRGRILPVATPPEGELAASFRQRVLGGEPMTAPAYPAADDSQVVARVRSTPGAIGYVSMAWADRGARALPVSALTGLPYRKPDAERVYDGEYPFTRFLNLFVRAGGARLANGLVTFVTSLEGQRIVHEAGRVPSAVPVRFARRSPMLGTH